MSELRNTIKALVIHLPSDEIVDWDTFHSVFQKVFGFPEFYGRTMDAWIDCMTCLDDPSAGLSNIRVECSEIALLNITNAEKFKQRCPEQFNSLIECSAFVNRRRTTPILSLVLT